MDSYPIEPTYNAQINSDNYESELLGENELGSVHVHGPFGNVNSNVKIAYLIGMHPLESKSHRALFNQLTHNNDLRYSYYLYNINVANPNSETEGRLEGQMLAQDFVKNDIINKGYDLFLDIHSNRGTRGNGQYEISNFVFAPGFDDNSMKYVNEILDNIKELDFYIPDIRTSPTYITEPTSKAGIATIIYECYSYEAFEKTLDLALKLVECVDNLEF